MSRRPSLRRVLWWLLTIASWGAVAAAARHQPPHPMLFNWWWTDFPLLAVSAFVAVVVSMANFAPGRRLIRIVRGPFLLVVMSTIVAIAGLEVFIRVFDPIGISYYSEMSRYILDRVPDPALKYRHRRNFESTYQGAVFRFNEVGLRDDPIGPKAPGELRILALGDSQTLGWGVAQDATWPAQLQRILTAKLGRPVRVINTGCASYETRQEYRYLLSDGYAFAPDVIVLMYMDNDLEITDEPYDPWWEKSFDGKSLGEKLYLLGRRLRVAQFAFYAKWLVPILYSSVYEPQQFGTPYALDESAREQFGWKESMAALRGIAESARARSVELAVVHFDWITFPFSRELSKAVREAVAPFPVAYVPEWFAGQNVRRYFNSTTDAHPNAEGCRVLAEHIAELLLSQGWLSPGSPPPPRPTPAHGE